jgi:hypothetical protein
MCGIGVLLPPPPQPASAVNRVRLIAALTFLFMVFLCRVHARKKAVRTIARVTRTPPNGPGARRKTLVETTRDRLAGLQRWKDGPAR